MKQTPNLEAMDACIRNIHFYFAIKDWHRVLVEIIWMREHLDGIENEVVKEKAE